MSPSSCGFCVGILLPNTVGLFRWMASVEYKHESSLVSEYIIAYRASYVLCHALYILCHALYILRRALYIVYRAHYFLPKRSAILTHLCCTHIQKKPLYLHDVKQSMQSELAVIYLALGYEGPL